PTSHLPLSSYHSSTTHTASHSSPTRRSSDLGDAVGAHRDRVDEHVGVDLVAAEVADDDDVRDDLCVERAVISRDLGGNRVEELRSEEHTSELQSLTNLVCRLLLEHNNNSTPL